MALAREQIAHDAPLFPHAIDVHAHHVPKQWEDWSSKYGGGSWPRIVHDGCCAATIFSGATPFRKITDQCWDPERRIEDMQGIGIARQAISPVPVMFCYWADAKAVHAFARMQNENTADIVNRYPLHFSGLGTVPLQDTDLAIAELRHCVEHLGLSGIEIGTRAGERDLDDPSLFPFFEACQALNAAIFIHPDAPLEGTRRLKSYDLPVIAGHPLETGFALSRLIFGGVLQRLPELRICAAHGGGTFPFLLGRLEHGWEMRTGAREKLSESPRQSAGRLYFDSLTHSAANIRFLHDEFGPGAIMLGSDYPFGMGEAHPLQALCQAGLPPDSVRAIASGNARRFLNLTDH